MSHVGRVGRRWVFLALAAAAALLHPPANGAGHRLTTRVSRPVVVNGQLYPSGLLSVRQIASYSPTSTLNEVWVGEECLGLLLAETRPGAGQAQGDALEFEVDDRGHLVLVGFSYRGQDWHELARPRPAIRGAWPRTAARAFSGTPPGVAHIGTP